MLLLSKIVMLDFFGSNKRIMMIIFSGTKDLSFVILCALQTFHLHVTYTITFILFIIYYIIFYIFFSERSDLQTCSFRS